MKWIVFVLFFIMCGASWVVLFTNGSMNSLEMVTWLLVSALASAVTAFIISWILKQNK